MQPRKAFQLFERQELACCGGINVIACDGTLMQSADLEPNGVVEVDDRDVLDLDGRLLKRLLQQVDFAEVRT